MPVYRYRTQGPAIAALSQEVPGTVSLSASGYFYVDITAVAGSKADLDDAMSSRGWLYVSQDPVNTPADEAGTQGADKISVYDEGTLLAKQPSINFIGAGVTAANNAGANRIDITIPSWASLTAVSPVNVNAAAAAVGTGTAAAREDHKHSVDTAAPVDIGTANAAGSGSNLALANHVHNTPFSAVNSALGGATASISVNSQKITNLLDPGNPQDACTKAYADALQQGLDIKNSCRLATIAALPAYTAAGSGITKTLTANANGALSIDGLAVVNTDRVLIKDQGATHIDHGIYTQTQLGDGTHPWILTRAVDANTSAKVTTGMYTFIEAGSNASSGWTLTTLMPITLDVTALGFTQFSGAGQIVAGAGLTKVGNTLNVVANADGSITVNADDVQVGVISDTQHGTRGGGTTHAAATTSVAGFMSSADKTKLDGVPTSFATDTLMWGNSGISTSTTARYLNPCYENVGALTAPIQFRVPRAGTIRNLRVHYNTAGNAGSAVVITYTVRKNSVATALGCAFSVLAVDGSDLSDSFTVAAGDILDIIVAKASSITTSPAGVVATVEYAA